MPKSTGKHAFLSTFALNQIQKNRNIKKRTQRHTNTPQPTIPNKACNTTASQKHSLHNLKTTHNFSKFLFLCNLHQFFCNCCVCWKRYKNYVFSKTHCSCITDSDTPFLHPFQQPFLEGGVPFSELTKSHKFLPILCLGGFWKPQKSRKWPKQLCAPKIPSSLSNSSKTVSVFLLVLAKSTLFPTTLKRNILLGIFWIYVSLIFPSSYVTFYHISKKTTKLTFSFAKSTLFRSGPFFVNTGFAPLQTMCKFTNAQNTINFGEISKNKLGPDNSL